MKMHNNTGSVDSWSPNNTSMNQRQCSSLDLEDNNKGFRNSLSPEFDHDQSDCVEKDYKSADYRYFKRGKDRRDWSKEDFNKSYRDREDRYNRQKDRSSLEKERDRSRGEGKSRDRDLSRDKDRNRRRDRDRDRDRKPQRNNRIREQDDEHSRESEDYEHNEKQNCNTSLDGVHYKNQTANNTIMIRGLAHHITEHDIRQNILIHGLFPKDIRLIRKKDTGASRGFAFVEFNATEEATRWMEMKQGIMMLQDHYRALMQYSIPKDSTYSSKSLQDWHCIKCGAHNFKRRESCFKCSASRAVSEDRGEGSDEVSNHPTSTVLLRGLDVLSTEESILQAMQSVSSQPIRSMRIGRDSLTNTSRGVCYLEMDNVVDAMNLHGALLKQGLSVDEKKVEIAYCKLYQTGGVDKWRQNDSKQRHILENVPHLAEYSANLYATTSAQKSHYVQYYTEYYQYQIAQSSTINLSSQNQTDCVNAAAAVAHTAIQQKLNKKISDSDETKFKPTPAIPFSTTLSTGRIPAHSSDGKVYNVPDVSSYNYDKTSGYYYDATTGLYYDPNTQYYYNSHTQQFLFWDVESYSYKPVQQIVQAEASVLSDGISHLPVTNTADYSTDADGKKKELKQDKAKVAKKIAKDMERWAKTLNQKKENVKNNFSLDGLASDGYQSSTSAAADAGYAVLEKKNLVISIYPEDADLSETNGLVAAYGEGSDSEEEIESVQEEEKRHTDWSKLACLLCKRQFPNKEVLLKHQQLSELHKQNLQKWYQVRGLDPNDPQQRNKKYRDRAKERRIKYGEPELPKPNKLKERY